MLLPPKSLRSLFGDSERFNPLQREGDRFTADGEEEDREKDKKEQKREKKRVEKTGSGRREKEKGAVY